MTRDQIARATDMALGFVVALGIALVAILVLGYAPPAVSESHEIAAKFDVEVVFTDALPCGDEMGGCFLPQTPDVVYVRNGLAQATRNSVILHEIGHVLQHRLRLPQDECAADAFAQSMGATVLAYDCD